MSKQSTKILLTVFGLASLGIVAIWQFYLFVVFKNPQGVVDVQGGSIHLWLAIGIALVMCVAGFFAFLKFLTYDRQSEIHVTAQGVR